MYIEESVISVVNQTYANIELVVIDDGSDDNSIELLKSLQNKYEFTLIIQDNSGVCKTLNRAITKFCNGKYVGILASDDYWHPEKLKKQMTVLMEKEGSDFCFTQALEFDSDSGDTIRVFPKKPLSGEVLEKVFIRQHVPAGSILFSRELYDEVGGFDENLREEDWDFVIRCAAKTRFTSVKEPLFFYRSHANNTMKSVARTKIFHQKALILAKNYPLVSPYVWIKSISIHFMYDHFFSKISDFKLLKRYL